MATRETLSTVDWIKAGFRALTVGGPQAIRAEAIARDLKVSKGSFYWHFKGLPAFKVAMLEHWRAVATEGSIALIEASGSTPGEQLRGLLTIATEGREAEYGGVGVEGAIRNWARFDGVAGAILSYVDEARLGYLELLFQGCGKSEEESRRASNIFYGALIGTQNLSDDRQQNIHNDLSALLDMLLVTQQKPFTHS